MSKATSLYNAKDVTEGVISPLIYRFVAGKYLDPNSSDFWEYQLYSPPAGAAASTPLVVWLHGAGEVRSGLGIQNQQQMRGNEEGTAWVKDENQAVRKAYVLVPQSPGWTGDDGWTGNGGTMVKAVIDGLVASNPDIDPKRIYIAGDSMGGMGTMHMLATYPNFFAAAATAPGGITRPQAGFEGGVDDGDAASIANIITTPIWSVSIKGDMMDAMTLEMWNTLQAAGANIRWTFYPGLEVLADNNYGQTHWSWIQLLQNLPTTDDQYMYDGSGYNGKYRSEDPAGQTLMDWLFAHSL
jgi:predicted peptidase